MSKLAKLAWVLTGIAGVSVASAIAITVGPMAKETKSINLGNKYLEEMDYESAIVAYNVAIEVNPNSKEAIEGLMQAAYASGNYDTLIASIEAYANVIKMDEMNEEEEHTLFLMTSNAYESFDNNEEYAKFVEGLCEGSESGELDELKKDAYYAYLASLMSEGKYAEANALVDEMIAEYPSESISNTKANALCKCAEEAWKNREFDLATEYLKEALEYAKDDASVKDYLLRVIEDYAIECKNNQDYEKANELISYIQDLRGDNSLADISVEIAKMEEADETLQGIIETLNGYFEADDIDAISDLMTSADFTSNALKVKSVLYSDSVKSSGTISGKGTAIYNVGGTPYVYYGDFANGKRNGSGLWYYASSKGELCKYTLEWINDLPNGAGTYDYYSSMDIVGYGGDVLYTLSTHDTATFTTVNGIMTGTYTRTSRSSESSVTVSCELIDGYAPRIEPGDYPSLLLDYMAYPRALSMYGTASNGGYSWWYWTPSRFKVDGLTNHVDPAISDGSIDLVLE